MFDPKMAIEWLIAKQRLCHKVGTPVTELVGELYQQVDQFSEADLSGISDFLALYAEQLEQLDEVQQTQVKPVLERVDYLLEQIFSASPKQVSTELITCLQNSNWPEPLPEEDSEFLLELLSADCAALCQAEEPTDLQLPSVEECSKAEENEDDFHAPTPCAEIKVVLADLPDQLEQLDTVSEELYELVDRCSEEDFSGVSDLLALYAELIGQVEDETLHPLLLELNTELLILLSGDEETNSLANLFLKMADSQWPDPVPDEDLSFLEEILLQDLQRLSGDEPTAANESGSALSEALPKPPAFCEIDFSLLEQEGPEVAPDVVAMLSQSIAALQEQWQQQGSDLQIDLEVTQETLASVIRALGTLHLLGAKVLSEGLLHNFRYLHGNQLPLSEEIILSVQSCFAAMQEYFVDISIYERQQALLDQFIDAQLPSTPNTEEASFIMGLLALASLQASEDIEQLQAKPEDVELGESEEVDPQLLDMLHTELPQLADEFQDNLQRLLEQGDQNGLRGSQRAVHTLKGLANMAGIRGLANLAHNLEDLLDFLADHSLLPSAGLSRDLQVASDCLAAMSDSVTDGTPSPDNALPVLQQIMDWDYRLKTEGAAALEQDEAESETSVQVSGVEDAQAELPEVTTAKPENPVFRVPRPVLDNLFRLVGESSTLNTQLDEEIGQLRSFTRTNRDRHRILQRTLFEMEQQFSEQMTLQPKLDENSDEFDPLEMDRYNELHTTISRVQEAVADVREVQQEMEGHIQSLNTLHIAQSGLQKETLENVLSTRLVPVKSITTRLQRILRQACRATGKQAELVIEGEETQVDSQILNQLADPLLHIIRNAVDHGLESMALRQQRGKPEQGTIKLSFSTLSDQIRVTCEDDGDGINTQRVQAVAEEKKLIEPGLELSEDEVQRLILIPGFSTRSEVNQLSGRGIGMDVVYQQILRLQGTLDIRSETRKGTSFQLSMPSSSLMVRTLLVRCGRQIFALAGHGIEQSLISLDGRLEEQNDQLTFSHDGETYPAYMLESLLAERAFDYQEAGAVYPVLIVNMAQGERVAVLVKEVIAHRELAFKQTGDYIPDLPGIPGLTILANGEAAPIVDLPARIRYQRSALVDHSFLPAPEELFELPRLLVVDDSLSARKSLASLLQDTGYEVTTAIDGLDALNQIRKKQPDLILTDMEMPRMGGVELSNVVRNRDETAHIPIMMITSRSTDKHREEANEAGVSAYVTKPWTENQLLDQVDNLLAEACV
ncbi:response regulator [Neptuniibacter sp.]|uniref:response regulator n=1 Tax=Neptuniibacter sp. TaxID=1962643 RepID=UPI0026313FD6|nr:response regulator [Neptuniibacter sp.]MCP4595948.1 response regulator [Neptuniibacter sp.]